MSNLDLDLDTLDREVQFQADKITFLNKVETPEQFDTGILVKGNDITEDEDISECLKAFDDQIVLAEKTYCELSSIREMIETTGKVSLSDINRIEQISPGTIYNENSTDTPRFTIVPSNVGVTAALEAISAQQVLGIVFLILMLGSIYGFIKALVSQRRYSKSAQDIIKRADKNIKLRWEADLRLQRKHNVREDTRRPEDSDSLKKKEFAIKMEKDINDRNVRLAKVVDELSRGKIKFDPKSHYGKTQAQRMQIHPYVNKEYWTASLFSPGLSGNQGIENLTKRLAPDLNILFGLGDVLNDCVSIVMSDIARGGKQDAQAINLTKQKQRMFDIARNLLSNVPDTAGDYSDLMAKISRYQDDDGIGEVRCFGTVKRIADRKYVEQSFPYNHTTLSGIKVSDAEFNTRINSFNEVIIASLSTYTKKHDEFESILLSVAGAMSDDEMAKRYRAWDPKYGTWGSYKKVRSLIHIITDVYRAVIRAMTTYVSSSSHYLNEVKVLQKLFSDYCILNLEIDMIKLGVPFKSGDKG